MPDTHIAIHEFGATTKSYVIRGGVVATGSIWDDCLNAITDAGFRPQAHPLQAMRRPGAWSSPGTNRGNAAASKAWGADVMGTPHLHGGQGVNHRCAIGCRLTPAAVAPGGTYQFMKIYLGEFQG